MGLDSINTANTYRDRPATEEESFVTDHRAALRPAQRVEQKLVEIMQEAPLRLSQLQAHRRPNER